ncbi:MAG: hypothetical protein Q7T82_09870 [Armatimonadota bacterium]|nr:hypothetical protein [Armatimonadota bacterium]
MKIQVPGRYPDREYGHCLLGNGVDLLYLDWSGAMAFKDQMNGIFGYWYKLDRKAEPHGDPLPLLRVKYCLVSEAGPIEIASSRQSFDPETASLVSEIEAGPFEFTVTSFLTNEHIFVLNFRFDRFPRNGSIYFALDDNRTTYTGKPVHALSEPVRYSVGNGRIYARFADKRECPFEGVGVMHLTGPGNGEMIEAIGNVRQPLFGSQLDKSDSAALQSPTFPYLTSGTLIRVAGVKPGNELTCCTCLTDDTDSPDYEARAEDILRQAVQSGYEETSERHSKYWRDYMGKAKISVSPDIDYQYKLSRYVLKAVQHPTGAMVPSPVFPNNHGCLVYWDAMFDQMAFLRNNRFEESEKITALWIQGLGQARENARALGKNEAYYGWTLDFEGRDHAALKVNQVHFNGDIALSCWRHYLYTRDASYLHKAFPVTKETIDFLISAYVEEGVGQMRVKPCETLDESAHERAGDTWTTALILVGIAHVLQAADILSEPLDREKYEGVRRGLLASLEKNCENGILYSHDGKGDLNVGSILSLIILEDLKPAGADDMKTYGKYLDSVMESSGVGWGHSSRMRCEIFPWAELIAAAFLAQRGDARAAEHLERAMSATNSFGGFAEYLWLHGSISRQWYVSAHGTFLWALSEMLVTARADDIVIFPAVPPDWESVSFSDLALPGNIRVSADMKQGKVSRVALTNADKEDAVKRVCHKDWQKTIRLPAGGTIAVEE